MKLAYLHPWKVSVQKAISIQQNLRKRIILGDNLSKIPNVATSPETLRDAEVTTLRFTTFGIKKIAGVDVGFSDREAVCAVCIFKYPKLNLIETVTAKKKINFSYVPGLLTFREGPAIIAAFRKLKSKPDLVLFDGQGICHPRGMGIATHLGIALDVPSIGCAKSHLYGVYQIPKDDKGSFSYIYPVRNTISNGVYYRSTKEVLGVALRNRQQVKPLFVSCGYRVSLKQAIKIVLKLCPKYRIPEPLRYAHHLAKNAEELSI